MPSNFKQGLTLKGIFESKRIIGNL